MAESKGSAKAAERSSAGPEGAKGDTLSRTAKSETSASSRAARRASDRVATREAVAKGKAKRTTKDAGSWRATNPVSKLIRFIREVVAELRKVIWPTRKELITYTTVVIVFVTIMVAVVWAFDTGFFKLVDWTFGAKTSGS